MREFRVSIDIAAPVETAWAVLADVERWPEWTASVERAEPVNGLPLRQGSQVRLFQPKLRPAVWTVTAWRPPHRFSWVSQQAGLLATADHLIQPTGNGCMLTLVVQYTGLLSGLVGYLARDLTNRYLALEAAGIKSRSEEQTVIVR